MPLQVPALVQGPGSESTGAGEVIGGGAGRRGMDRRCVAGD